MAFERTEFEAMMTTTVAVSTHVSFDGYGDATYSTSGSTYNAAISDTPRVVTSFQGDDIVPSVNLIVASTVAFNATDRFTLSDGSTPGVLNIDLVYDEDGLHHQVVSLGGSN